MICIRFSHVLTLFFTIKKVIAFYSLRRGPSGGLRLWTLDRQFLSLFSETILNIFLFTGGGNLRAFSRVYFYIKKGRANINENLSESECFSRRLGRGLSCLRGTSTKIIRPLNAAYLLPPGVESPHARCLKQTKKDSCVRKANVLVTNSW